MASMLRKTGGMRWHRCLLFTAAACSSSPTAPSATTQQPCDAHIDTTRPAAEVGERGQIQFNFLDYEDPGQVNGTTDFELDAGGSVTLVILHGVRDVPSGLTVRSSAPTVGTVQLVNDGGSSISSWGGACHALGFLQVTAAEVGNFDVVVEDATGVELDHKAFASVASRSLGVRTAWAAPGLALVGTSHLVHAVTRGPNGEILRGTGAVHFDLDGVLAQTEAMSGDLEGGDELWFEVQGKGIGSVNAVAGGLRESKAVTGVVPQDIDGLDLSVLSQFGAGNDWSAVVQAQATMHGLAVHGFSCAWSGLGDKTVKETRSSILGSDAAAYQFNGSASPITATCTIEGGPSRTIELPP
jgi:hypothetical protein